MMPNDLLLWAAVYRQAQRWLAAGLFEDIVHDLRVLPRLNEIGTRFRRLAIVTMHHEGFISCLRLHLLSRALLTASA